MLAGRRRDRIDCSAAAMVVSRAAEGRETGTIYDDEEARPDGTLFI
ncbi:hypothetical protein [Segnochrobactrum spirostomi]|nr:hypothetical protein [Segnochrobactrum spirostomi]